MQIKTPKDLGLFIRDSRKKLHLSQQDLADRVGVGRHWIVGIERGKPGAGVGLVLRTLHALGLEFSIEAGAGPHTASPIRRPEIDIDIDAVIDKARGRPR